MKVHIVTQAKKENPENESIIISTPDERIAKKIYKEFVQAEVDILIVYEVDLSDMTVSEIKRTENT